MFKNRYKRLGCLILFGFFVGRTMAQQQLTFRLERVNDSLSWLCLYPKTESDEAMVGVTKPTRFYPQAARRLFIFKQVNGKIRPMWMGSQLGGILCDFRFVKPYVRTLQATTDDKYVVADYVWDDFGLSFVRFLTSATSHEEAIKRFTSDE